MRPSLKTKSQPVRAGNVDAFDLRFEDFFVKNLESENFSRRSISSDGLPGSALEVALVFPFILKGSAVPGGYAVAS
jgi:hypothetical protein